MRESDAVDSAQESDSRDIQSQINKRLTLNLLIQGAAAHTFISASHLVRDELEELHPGLTLLYDRFAISGQLNYCIGENGLLFGRPNLLWGYSKVPQKPFRKHAVLSAYGNQLAREEVQHLKSLARPKKVTTIPFAQWCQLLRLLMRVTRCERGLETELERLAVSAASQIWEIDPGRLDASLTQSVAFGNLQLPRTWLGRTCRMGAIGYGGVEMGQNGQFKVVAKAWVFPLLVHELVKGIVELICLHGLNELEDDVYAAVTAEADQLEYEAWMLQAGPAMWRRLIALAPRNRPLAATLMHLAKLDPEPLDEIMLAVMEQPEQARHSLLTLGNA